MAQKVKPKKDPRLIKEIKWMHCAACGTAPPNDAHHIKTRGAGGGDTRDNLIPLCRIHHSEWHMLGLGTMLIHYPRLNYWMKDYLKS